MSCQAAVLARDDGDRWPGRKLWNYIMMGLGVARQVRPTRRGRVAGTPGYGVNRQEHRSVRNAQHATPRPRPTHRPSSASPSSSHHLASPPSVPRCLGVCVSVSAWCWGPAGRDGRCLADSLALIPILPGADFASPPLVRSLPLLLLRPLHPSSPASRAVSSGPGKPLTRYDLANRQHQATRHHARPRTSTTLHSDRQPPPA